MPATCCETARDRVRRQGCQPISRASRCASGAERPPAAQINGVSKWQLLERAYLEEKGKLTMGGAAHDSRRPQLPSCSAPTRMGHPQELRSDEQTAVVALNRGAKEHRVRGPDMDNNYSQRSASREGAFRTTLG